MAMTCTPGPQCRKRTASFWEATPAELAPAELAPVRVSAELAPAELAPAELATAGATAAAAAAAATATAQVAAAAALLLLLDWAAAELVSLHAWMSPLRHHALCRSSGRCSHQ